MKPDLPLEKACELASQFETAMKEGKTLSNALAVNVLKNSNAVTEHRNSKRKQCKIKPIAPERTHTIQTRAIVAARIRISQKACLAKLKMPNVQRV